MSGVPEKPLVSSELLHAEIILKELGKLKSTIMFSIPPVWKDALAISRGDVLSELEDSIMKIEHTLAYGDEHNADCPLCGTIDPRCDICGRLMEDSPNILPNMRELENDWNGETGNHILCEYYQDNERIKSLGMAWGLPK